MKKISLKAVCVHFPRKKKKKNPTFCVYKLVGWLCFGFGWLVGWILDLTTT